MLCINCGNNFKEVDYFYSELCPNCLSYMMTRNDQPTGCHQFLLRHASRFNAKSFDTLLNDIFIHLINPNSDNYRTYNIMNEYYKFKNILCLCDSSFPRQTPPPWTVDPLAPGIAKNFMHRQATTIQSDINDQLCTTHYKEDMKALQALGSSYRYTKIDINRLMMHNISNYMKPDLIICKKSLCQCELPTKLCCGFASTSDASALIFLARVAELLNIQNKSSMAVLHGQTYLSVPLWQHAAHEFSSNSGHWRAMVSDLGYDNEDEDEQQSYGFVVYIFRLNPLNYHNNNSRCQIL